MLAIVDLRMGNLQSVANAFERIGVSAAVTSCPQDLDAATAIVLPGVGAFGDGMAHLRDQGLIEPLRRAALKERKPLLGVCLGMQLLAEESEEHGRHQGLGFIPGKVVRLPEHPELRVPNVGWCETRVVQASSQVFSRVAAGEPFYFCHSFFLKCAKPNDVAMTVDVGRPIAVAVEHDNLFGMQFHPEKSQDAGLDLLETWCRYAMTQRVTAGAV